MDSAGVPLDPFLAVDRWLRRIGLHAPEVLAIDVGAGLALLEDLGDELVEHRLAALEIPTYEAVLDVLAHWQAAPAPEFLPALDDRTLLSLLDLFLERLVPDEGAHAPFRGIWHPLLSAAAASPTVFVHRDFHCRNLLWCRDATGLGRIGIVDFQDAFRGPPLYDLVSLLQDARRDVGEATAQAMWERFLRSRPALDRTGPERDYAVLGAQRAMRILAVFDRVAAGCKSLDPGCVPRVRRHLRRNLRHPALSELRAWCEAAYPALGEAD